MVIKMSASVPQIARWARAVAGCLVASTLYSACSSGPFGETNCLAIAYAGVNVTIPGGSELARLGKTISGTLTQADYSEQMHLSVDPSGQSAASLAGAYERAGTYSLRVNATGYQEFRKDNLVVKKTRDGCHVDPITVTATLNPL